MPAPAMPRRTPIVLPALVALLLFATSTGKSHAGIYNMQSILATEAEEGLSGAIGGSVDWRRGNVEYLFLSATPLARYKSGDHLLIGMMRGDHKTSGDTTIISNTLEHIRYRYTITDSLLAEAFAQHMFDDVRRLNLRALVGVGPQFSIVDGKAHSLDVGVAYMLEYERLQEGDFDDSGVTDLAHRNSTYVTALYEVDDRVQLGETIYVQPRLTDLSDTRLLSQSQLTFKITERLSYTAAVTIAYDSRPPDAIKKLDTALQTSLTFEL